MTKKVTVDQVEVRHHDGPLLLPEGLGTEKAIEVLKRKLAYDNQTFEVQADFEESFIWEAAYALSKVLEEKHGWAGAQTKVVETFFGPLHIPPKMMGVKVSATETVQVPWGQFAVPGINGYLESSASRSSRNSRWFFQLNGEVLRKDEKKVNEIIEGVRKFVRERSIYRNKAFRLRMAKDGEQLQFPEIVFERLNPNVEAELVLPEITDRMVRVNLFTPIEKTAAVKAAGVPLKRGILLAGEYGTGKTMIANVTALKAIRNGWTYIVCEDPTELTEIIRVARQYQPCVVFCEDIDRVTSGERGADIDAILNVIDGVEAKGTEIMVVLTTNAIDRIDPGMLRPGRMDNIVTVGPPDAFAAERLARQYARGLIPADAVLERSPQMMAGKIPAVIREITERSKLAAIDTLKEGDTFQISDDDLVISTLEMEEHIRRATPRATDLRTEREKAADRLGWWMNKAADADPFVGITLGEGPSAEEVLLD